MIFTKPGLGQLVAGGAGVIMVLSLFLPWASAGGDGQSGWELLAIADVYLLIVGLVALGTALTGGRFGVFRPDMSLNAAADLLALVATVQLVWLLFFDFPDGAARELGAWLALGAAVAIAAGVGDYRPLREGAAWFPPLSRAGRAEN